MEKTEIFQLTTESEVGEFCKRLLQMKSEAPVSLIMSVAVMVSRKAIVRDPWDEEKEKRSPIEAGFDNLKGG